MAEGGRFSYNQREYYALIYLENCMIKGYHEFKIKLPIGAHVEIQREQRGRDSDALLCIVPQDLEEQILNTRMYSKSSKTSYQVKDVVGKTMGRVQYFLNTELSQLMREGKVSEIKGFITGEAQSCKIPPSYQAWQKNNRPGGGAVIPCTLRCKVPEVQEFPEIVEKIKATLSQFQGGKKIKIKVKTFMRKLQEDPEV